MPHPRIVIPDDDPVAYGSIDHPDLRRLTDIGEVVYYGTRPADRAEFFRRIADADALINVRGYSKFDEETFANAPKLKHVAVLGVGIDNVDVEAARRHGVTVTNTPGANFESVAEIAMGLVLAVARTIPLSDRRMREGIWQQVRGPRLYGRTAGIVGLGIIGRHFARICQGFGMRTIGWSRSQDPQRAAECGVEMVERDELFRQADVVSLHLASTLETRGFVSHHELSLMKPTAILVNTARGAVVDAPALYECLKEHRIFGAGLDVHVPEPYPLEQNIFKDLDNVVLMPHGGGSTWEAAAKVQQMPVDNLIAFFQGNPTNVVT